jgi:hypothetical protein
MVAHTCVPSGETAMPSTLKPTLDRKTSPTTVSVAVSMTTRLMALSVDFPT